MTAQREHGSTRRIRSTRRNGALARGAAVAALLALTGCVDAGTGDGADPAGDVQLPADSVTFAFTPGGTFDAEELSTGSLRVADPAALGGTVWELQDVWMSERELAEVTGSSAGTTLSFTDAQGQGWGLDMEGCGGVWAQDALALDAEGTFPGPEVSTTDIGCPGEVQAMEDFWMWVLPGGGALHVLDGPEVLLLSVPEGRLVPR
ncbi:hypothetical protein [Serinicoccus sp. LYQ131]|uniref:hypothetical protein n=1 Tax=Serinicoccus sp. LYQ131 TaxID=3378797 RepID=UPI0038530B67